MNYKDRLKELREENNLTQEELAKKIDLTRGAYKQYELQYDIIPLNHLNNICNYFKVSIDYMLCLTNQVNYDSKKDSINNEIFSVRIKALRKENNCTQEKFALSLPTNQSIISDLEKGRKLANTSLLYTICTKYHISADYLLGKTDSPKYLN